MNISVDKLEVMKNGNQILEIASDFDSCINKLEGIVDSINYAWNGADALKYINNFKDKYLNNLKNITDDMNKYGEYLVNTSKAYDLLDEVFSSKNIGV